VPPIEVRFRPRPLRDLNTIFRFVERNTSVDYAVLGGWVENARIRYGGQDTDKLLRP